MLVALGVHHQVQLSPELVCGDITLVEFPLVMIVQPANQDAKAADLMLFLP